MELHNLYSAPYVVRVIRSRRLRWAGHKACAREMRSTYKSVENVYGRDYIGDLVIDGRTILKSVLQDDVRCLQG